MNKSPSLRVPSPPVITHVLYEWGVNHASVAVWNFDLADMLEEPLITACRWSDGSVEWKTKRELQKDAA